MIKRIPTRSLSYLWLISIFTVLLGSATHAQTIETVIPSDSFLYLKLQNLQECRVAIGSSENWKAAAGFISAASQWQDIQQLMQALPMFTGADIQGLIETFLGSQVAVTVSPGAAGLMVGIVIENSGNQRQAAEQILSQVVTTLSGMAGNPVQPEVGDYQGITYHTAQLNTLELTYGRVDETLLLVGITPGSFEKMVDTYKTKGRAITENTAYRPVADKFGKSEVFAYVDVETGGPYLKALLPPVVGKQLDAFQTLVYRWDLLKPGGSQQLSGTLKNGGQGTLISLFQEPSKMQAIQGLSGDEVLFLTVAPSSSQTFWRMLFASERNTTSIDESLRSFLIPDQTDLLAAVTGELVISADISFLEKPPNFNTGLTGGKIERFKVEFAETDLGLIFNPASPLKWRALFNGLLEKLSTESPQQFDYKGMTFNTAAISGTLYYGSVNELFVIALSEKQYKSIVDNLLTGNPTSSFKRRLEDLPANPACLFQLNIEKLLPFVETEGLPWWRPEVIAFTQKVGVLFASLAVGADAASLELTLSPEEKPIDAIARLAPILFFVTMMLSQR
ncbi:hypothetical protein F4Y59_06010 [Candidatus Poribacteria bacterium]|nr:hypothetical protein [Candidatus Poribacteria bacterium]MXY27699.1 hypothetical protein [Candidatus Poribacteria bacterium]